MVHGGVPIVTPWRPGTESTLTGWMARVDEVMGEAVGADHPNAIAPSIPPDAAKGYIGVGVSALWMIPGAMI